MKLKIYSIIVTYNGIQHNWIQKCLDSLLASSIKTEIIVIDNGSTDGTVDFIQKKYPQVDLIEANENLGFAKANNIGIKKAYEQGADYVFLLNQDAWVEKETIEKLVEVFKQMPDSGVVSPIHLNGNCTNLDYGFINYISQQNTPDFISDLYFGKLKECYETKFVNAASWLISRNCIEKVGGFDTSVFYHYGEDDNYCQRVIYHGFKIYITATTTICHDREDRKGKWSKEHEQRTFEVSKMISYANILSDEKLVDNMILSLKRRLTISHSLKKILRFTNIFSQRKADRKELALFYKIEESRKKNKQGGLVWL